MSRPPSPATVVLQAHLAGDPRAADKLLPLIYEELRALAARHMREERPGHTLQPTAVVHEAWLRLIDQDQMEWQGRAHFLAMAATTMRRVLVDHARARLAQKRGGGQWKRVPLRDDAAIQMDDPLQALALDEALRGLEQVRERLARVVELRVLAGLSLDETAAALDVSRDTAKRDWRFARAWLNRELVQGHDDDRA